MATNLKIRNSGLYRLLLFAVCVLAFSQVLLGLRALEYRMLYGEAEATDFFQSASGVSGMFVSDIQLLTDRYISETMEEEFSPGFTYYITGRRGSFTNAEQGTDIFRDSLYSIKISGNRISYGTGLPERFSLQIPAADYPDMVIGLSEEAVTETKARFDRMAEALTWNPWVAGISAIGLLAGVIELLSVTGRTADGGVRLTPVDRWPTELYGIVLLLLSYYLMIFLRSWLSESTDVYAHMYSTIRVYYFGLIGIFGGILAVLLLLARKSKAGRLLGDALLYRLGAATLSVMRGDAEDLARTEQSFKIALRYVLVSAVLVGLWMGSVIHPVMAITFLVVSAVIFLYLLRTGMKVSEESVRASVEEQVKAERLKIDLVTNVSHDLNTPLTSIIGYVDLLQDEDMSEPAREYVEILRRKSLRLKGIVADLFDLSKSSSGAVERNPETLNYSVLIRQTLSDLSDTIESSDRELIAKLPDDPVWVTADGTQLYRVLQNLIDNALRYSQAGTRIFLRLEAGDDAAHLTLRNVSAYPLDFDKEEILARFVRGDLARTTNGSGLGLAIAKSFTENNDGNFQVFAEEDVFIAMQTLKLASPPVVEQDSLA